MIDPFAPAQVAMAIKGLGADASGAADLADELRERHRELHRRHHTAEHIREVLAEVLRLVELEESASSPGLDPASELDPGWSPALHVAVLFHDAIYDVHAPGGANEEASAQLAAARLVQAGLAPDHEAVHEVIRLIRLTAGHVVDPADASGGLLVDADLWILSAPAERYDRCAAAVRWEYGHLSDEVWTLGRTSVLQGFLDGIDGLFTAGSEADRAHRRARAAANLSRELATLTP